jgi:glycerol-3-phosphate acyltransferase PlsY
VTPPLLWIAVALGAYLLGSIPFGLLLTRAAGLGDLRAIGSGNIGATNVLRTGKKGLAAATLLLDGGKGALAVLLAASQGAEAAALASVFVVAGHLFPVWLKFKGGKGVATALGVWLALAPIIGLAACAVWLLTAAVFRYSSLAALTALAIAPALAFWLYGPVDGGVGVLLALAVFFRHDENIKRLIKGAEPKIGRTHQPQMDPDQNGGNRT